MPDYLSRPVTQLRRKDRALREDEWMERLLALAPVGHLATVFRGEPMLHSNYFWYDAHGTSPPAFASGEERNGYDAHTVYWHTAGSGRLRAMLDAEPGRGCFTATEFGRVLPAGTPFDFSTEYASVVCYGLLRVVADANEKRHALDGLMAKYAPHLVPGVDYAIMPESDIAPHERVCARDRGARRQAQRQAARLPGVPVPRRLVD